MAPHLGAGDAGPGGDDRVVHAVVGDELVREGGARPQVPLGEGVVAQVGRQDVAARCRPDLVVIGARDCVPLQVNLVLAGGRGGDLEVLHLRQVDGAADDVGRGSRLAAVPGGERNHPVLEGVAVLGRGGHGVVGERGALGPELRDPVPGRSRSHVPTLDPVPHVPAVGVPRQVDGAEAGRRARQRRGLGQRRAVPGVGLVPAEVPPVVDAARDERVVDDLGRGVRDRLGVGRVERGLGDLQEAGAVDVGSRVVERSAADADGGRVDVVGDDHLVGGSRPSWNWAS